VFDEFDEFFDFKRQAAETGVNRDDTRGADYKSDVDISFVQAVLGTRVKVELNKRIICHSCRG
jgi:molecular chaperone DnaJ